MPKKAAGSPRKKTAEEVPKRLQPAKAKREVKEVPRFVFDSAIQKSTRAESPIVIKKGKGKKIGDIENVMTHINKRTKSDSLLHSIHGLLLGRSNKKTAVKENLKSFSGVVYDDEKHTRLKLEAKLEKLRLTILRNICAFFGVDPHGKREDLVNRLADWLEKPAASKDSYEISGEEKKASGKRKRSASTSRSPKKATGDKKKRKKKDPNAPKRGLSAYMFFVKENRGDLVKKYPKEKVTEIASRLGAAWKKASDSEKKKCQAKADKDKERYEKEMKKYKPKA